MIHNVGNLTSITGLFTGVLKYCINALHSVIQRPNKCNQLNICLITSAHSGFYIVSYCRLFKYTLKIRFISTPNSCLYFCHALRHANNIPISKCCCHLRYKRMKISKPHVEPTHHLNIHALVPDTMDHLVVPLRSQTYVMKIVFFFSSVEFSVLWKLVIMVLF